MKPTDYHSSTSSDEEEDESEAGRLSDDSEHNFSDDDNEAASSVDEAEFDDEEASADEADKSTKKPASDDDDAEAVAGDDDDDDADSEGADSSAEGAEGNANWAKTLAKILKQEKPKNKKAVTLSKAKKTSEILEAREKAKAIGFDIEGEIKEEKPDADQLEDALAEAERKRKKKAAFNLRIKPSLGDRERERAFKKIATKGVVQLFNAVRTQQKDLSEQLEQAGRLDHKRDAVLNNINKRKFLDVLMGGKRAKSENVDNPVKDELKEEDDDESMDDEVYNDGLPKNSIWSVLKEDFLSNKKMSHWDKDEDEDQQANTDGDDDDDDSD